MNFTRTPQRERFPQSNKNQINKRGRRSYPQRNHVYRAQEERIQPSVLLIHHSVMMMMTFLNLIQKKPVLRRPKVKKRLMLPQLINRTPHLHMLLLQRPSLNDGGTPICKRYSTVGWSDFRVARLIECYSGAKVNDY